MKPFELITAGAVVAISTVVVSKFVAPRFEEAETHPSLEVTTRAPSPYSAEPATTLSANSAQLRLENDGHYWASANVDGAHVRFMVDTGASTVALTYRDAQRIGLNPDRLDYRWTIRTAGGEVKGASVLLNSIQIGRVEVENVEAMVLRDGLNQSLLGMSFLSELESYEFRRGNLILRQ